MNRHLSPPVSRALALAILVGLMAVLYLGIAQPLADTYAGNRERIAQLQDTLIRYQRAAQELHAREQQLAGLKRQAQTADGFLRGPSDTLIAADIQNRIKTLADRAKAELKSSQVLPPETEGKLKRIAVRGQMSANIGGVLSVFHDLEAASPYLFVDNVNMRVRPLALRDRSDPGNGEIIDVQFDVYGYAQASG